MTFTCTKCGGECKYAVAPPVCPYCQDGGWWYDRGPSHFAQNVPIVDQPEAYAKMREAAGLCSDCGGDRHAHMSNCPRIAAAVAQMPLPQPTAYDRDQQALRDRVVELERRADVNVQHIEQLGHRYARIDAALRRIEQLERDIALDRAEAIKSEKRIEQLELELAKLKGPALIAVPVGANIDLKATHLACGCPGPWCNGHQFSASPATAYPPLPDEGT